MAIDFGKWIIVASVASALLIAAGAGKQWGLIEGKKQGVSEGLDLYHKYCYNVGGVVVNPLDNTLIMCNQLGELPEEEVEKLHKKPVDKVAKT